MSTGDLKAINRTHLRIYHVLSMDFSGVVSTKSQLAEVGSGRFIHGLHVHGESVERETLLRNHIVEDCGEALAYIWM